MNRRTYYPSRCSGEHIPIVAVGNHSQGLLRGRLVRWDGAKGVLQDQTGSIKLRYDTDGAEALST